jgi:tetratricopeptide (TPR) repeat protein
VVSVRNVLVSGRTSSRSSVFFQELQGEQLPVILRKTSGAVVAQVYSYDVFLSYSRIDADAVGHVQSRLKEAGLSTFIDRDQLPSGQPWLSALAQAIAHSDAVAVFVGPTGLGTWQQREIQLALDRQAEAERSGRPFPVIPILLPKVEDPPGGFLRLQTWVDLRSDLADPAQLQLLLTGIRGHAPADASSVRDAFCPYRGLLSFREEDAGLFFGREQEVDALVGKLREHSIVTLVGRSGSGKSSVVYAGLIPALRRRTDGRTWSILSLRPGSEPLHALVRAFDQPPADMPPFEEDQRVERQVKILRTTEGALGGRIRSLLTAPDERGSERLLIHVDQWEELYTQALRLSASTPKQAEDDVNRFIALLLEATRTSPCAVVLTVRADFYGELLKHGSLAAALPPGQVNLGPMRREGLAAAIKEPARAIGLTVDTPLVEELLDEVCDEIGKLPLLEYALKETWRAREGDRLTLNAYGQSGGIDGAVAKRANEIFAHLKPTEQDAARRLFVSLVTPGEGREDTRARALYPEQDEAIRAVVQEFSSADARLLVTGADVPTAQHMVEISHEALIREWDLLREWIKVNRDALRRREYIRGQMREWQERGWDKTLLLRPGLPLEEGRKLLTDHGDVLIEEVEPYITASIEADEEQLRQNARQRRRRTYVAAAGFVLVTAFAVFAVFQWREAQESEARAKNNLVAATQTVDALTFDIAQGLQNVAGMRGETVRRILETVEGTITKLSRSAPENLDLQRSRVAMLNSFGSVYSRSGDRTRALQAYEDSLAMARRLAASNPGNAEWQRDVSTGLNNIGTVRRDVGDGAGALQAFEESLAIARRLAVTDPGNTQWQRDVSANLGNIGVVRRDTGDLVGALQVFEESLAIVRRLAAAAPGNTELQRYVSANLNNIGNVRLAVGDRAGALQAFEESHSIVRRLAAADPGNTASQRDVSFLLNNIGVMRRSAGDRAGALQAFEESLASAGRLTATDPGNTQWQRDVSAFLNNIGDVRQDAGEHEGALRAYEESLAIRRRLAAADPGNTERQRDVSTSLNNIGGVRLAAGDQAGALQAYEESLAIRRQLAAADPGSTERQRDVSTSLNNIGGVRLAAGNQAGALQAYEESLAIVRRLAAADAGNTEWQRDLSTSLSNIGIVRVAAGDRAGARRAFEEGLAIGRRLAAADPGNTALQRYVSSIHGGIMALIEDGENVAPSELR